MCATDIISRGVDTHWVRVLLDLDCPSSSIQVEHVIQFDFPRFISDYIHRAGRVGRIGSKRQGKVSSFVTRPDEINLAQKIEVNIEITSILPRSLSSLGHCSIESKTERSEQRYQKAIAAARRETRTCRREDQRSTSTRTTLSRCHSFSNGLNKANLFRSFFVVHIRMC